jgi:hypothetical protein
MMTTELSFIQRNAAESQRLAEAMAEFERRGGKVAQVNTFSHSPKPPRKDWIDPETVLHRKPSGLRRAERVMLRQMAGAL